MTYMTYDYNMCSVSTGHGVMTDKRKGIIAQNYEILTNNLTAGSMLNNLVSASVISMAELEMLNAERVEQKRSGLLLGMLLKKEDSTFDVLIKALDKYNMTHLSTLLKTAGRCIIMGFLKTIHYSFYCTINYNSQCYRFELHYDHNLAFVFISDEAEDDEEEEEIGKNYFFFLSKASNGAQKCHPITPQCTMFSGQICDIK